MSVLEPARAAARFGPVLWLLIRREFTSRYAGSSLGAVWNVVHPIVLIAIYLLVFSKLMVNRTPGGEGSTLDYAVHLTSGIVPWFLFSEVVQRGTTVLTENANFLKKLALPPEILHLSVLANALFVNYISLVVLIILLTVAGAAPGFDVIFAFPLMILLGVFALGISFFLSVLHVVLRDVGQIVSVGLQFLFWLTPIVYYFGIEVLPPLAIDVLEWNPLLPFVGLNQRIFGSPGHSFYYASGYHLIFVLPVVALILGSLFLRKHRLEILDEL